MELRKALAVEAADADVLAQAGNLAERLGTDLIEEGDCPEDYALLLRYDRNGLTLTDGAMSLKADFSTMLPRLKQGRLQGEMLVKAARIKGAKDPLRAIDATAGLGEDSILLAAAGFEVTMFERDPVIAALLEDALRRARQMPELAEVASRMALRQGNSIDAMKTLDFDPDVILLDPMFPSRRKSASIKKKFQLLHHLEKPCDDEEGLLEAAIAANPRKIVVKRPVKGPYLAARKPAYSLQGKAIRYDCLVFARP